MSNYPPPSAGPPQGPPSTSTPPDGPPSPPGPPVGPPSVQGPSPYDRRPVSDHPHDEPTPYALTLRNRNYRPWKPILGVLLCLLGMFVIAPLVLMPLLIGGTVIEFGMSDIEQTISEVIGFDRVSITGMLFLNLSLAALIPITWMIVRWVHGMKPRWLASVAPRVRWRFLGACFLAALPAVAASILLGEVLPGDANGLAPETSEMTGTLWGILLVVLLTTPLQSIGEEYLFRGYGMQAFGALTNSQVFAVVCTAFLFALAHGGQNFPLFFDRFAFGLAAGLLVVLTGGLEAGIALHVVNNLVAFIYTIFLGDLSATLTVSEAPWTQIILTLTQNAIFIGLVLLIAGKMKIRTKTDPPAADPVPVSY